MPTPTSSGDEGSLGSSSKPSRAFVFPIRSLLGDILSSNKTTPESEEKRTLDGPDSPWKATPQHTTIARDSIAIPQDIGDKSSSSSPPSNQLLEEHANRDLDTTKGAAVFPFRGHVAASTMDSSDPLQNTNESYSNDRENTAAIKDLQRELSDVHGLLFANSGKPTQLKDSTQENVQKTRFTNPYHEKVIQSPDAIQGYGVLMVLQDNFETGKLSVRQVSENSTKILGLSPEYLFSLDCFTTTLSPDQAVDFKDKINLLEESDSEASSVNSQSWMIQGQGEPGICSGHCGTNSEARREWTCWIVAHRPKKPPPKACGDEPRPLILVEFELERDTLNPLYPELASGSASSSIENSSSGSSLARSRSSNDSGLSSVSLSNIASPATNDLPTKDDLLPLAEAKSSIGNATDVSSLAPNSSLPKLPQHKLGPTADEILEATTSRSRPLKALKHLRRQQKGTNGPRRSVASFDALTLLSQVNEQLSRASTLEELFGIVVGIVKDLTQFHRVVMYQFDADGNRKALAELIDWNHTRDLYKGLHFPASIIPLQEREIRLTNHIQLLYNREQPLARMIVKDGEDSEQPLDMSGCLLRAMDPVRLKRFADLGINSSLSISIVVSDNLWGLVSCQSYGQGGMRPSFTMRQVLRLVADSISKDVERLTFAKRMNKIAMIKSNPMSGSQMGVSFSGAEDLLIYFEADYGIMVVGEAAKILGPTENGQDILLIAEYLRVKQFQTLQSSFCISQDFPNLQLPSGPDIVAGVLLMPLSESGADFICLMRRSEPDTRWARPPYRNRVWRNADGPLLESTTSFTIWTEPSKRQCRSWTEEQLSTAASLSNVFSKHLLLREDTESRIWSSYADELSILNTSKQVRTDLRQIISYLEVALDSKKLDGDSRENLSRSHAASKALLFTINDLLDLTRVEQGYQLSFRDPFDLHQVIYDVCQTYRSEAQRQGLEFNVDLGNIPHTVLGDGRKLKRVLENLISNAVKYTETGEISIIASLSSPQNDANQNNIVAIEFVVRDTGCGIPSENLELLFRELEQVDSDQKISKGTVGLGLAVTARSVEQLGGHLRVTSHVGEGSSFSCIIPFPVVTPAYQWRIPSLHGTSELSRAFNRYIPVKHYH